MQANNPQGPNQGSQGGSQKPSLSWSQPAAAQKSIAPAQPSSSPKSAPQGAKTEKSNTNTYVGIFVGGLVIGLVLGWGVASMRSGAIATNSNTSTTTNSVNTPTSNTTGSANAVDLTNSTMGASGDVVIDAQPAGLSVSVSKAVVSAPTWVVIYDDNNGVPGHALGAGLFFPAATGGATSGTISLLRGTTAGQTYLVGESLDDGDHIFSLQNDKPVRDEKGNPVWMTFKTN